MNNSNNLLTGASLVFTSVDPAMIQARQMFFSGRLIEAEQMFTGDEPAAEELRDLIARMRLAYPMDADAFLKKVLRDIPDATIADVNRWIKTGQLQTRSLDGKTMIFMYEPVNLFRRSDEARQRKVTPSRGVNQPMCEHRRAVIAQAAQTDAIEVCPIHHHVHAEIVVPGKTTGMKAGSRLRVWLPLAQEYRQQKNVKILNMPAGAQVAENGWTQRTIYAERVIDDPTADQVFSAEFEYDSHAYYPMLDDKKAVASVPAEIASVYLAERLPHIQVSQANRQLVRQITGGDKNPLAAARKIFLWISHETRYVTAEEYCLCPSLGQQAIDQRQGDCGMRALIFVTLCRCAGIPARFQSGFQSRPGESGMHDWSEFYVQPWGWLPCDADYGLQPGDTPAEREFHFGHQDAHRLIVNLDYGSELVPPKKSLRSEPADFQRGEVELDGKNLYYNQWRYKVGIEIGTRDNRQGAREEK